MANGLRMRSTGRCFEVQTYYLSFAPIRQAALHNGDALAQQSKRLFDDREFVSSIEATTKSIENYRVRFGRYQRMLQSTLNIPVEPIVIASRCARLVRRQNWLP